MTLTDPGLAKYLKGRNHRALSEGNRIIADARAIAYKLVQEAGAEEARTIAELKNEIIELKAERTGLRRSLARTKAEKQKLTDGLRERAEQSANEYGAKLKLRARQQADKLLEKARCDAQEIREDAERTRLQAEEDGARMAGMSLSELDEARRAEGLSRLHIATAEAYPHHHEGRLAA